jgi:hypothetical protein
VTVVGASAEHLSEIVAMARAARAALAQRSPITFAPSAGADDLHAAWLGFLVSSPDQDTRIVLDDDGAVVAFGVVNPLVDGVWLDDLCVASDGDWSNAGRALVESVDARPAITCVSVHDPARADAMRMCGWTPVSYYWAIHPSAVRYIEHESGSWTKGRHTFAGGVLSAETPGALVVRSDAGTAVGSPSVTPPLYDPGGSSCVVDHLDGDDRSALLRAVAGVAYARGDHQLIVVSHVVDRELASLLAAVGFEPYVAVYGALTPN